MDLHSYLNSLSSSAQAQFAESLGTSVGYLRKAISIGSEPQPERALAIELISHGVVTRQELLPTRWMLIWPDLTRTGGSS